MQPVSWHILFKSEDDSRIRRRKIVLKDKREFYESLIGYNLDGLLFARAMLIDMQIT